MTALTRSIKTLVASTDFLSSFYFENEDHEFILGQSARRVKANQFYLFQKQDFSNRRVSERVPLYLTASIYGKDTKKVRFTFDDTHSVSEAIVEQVEAPLLNQHLHSAY
tara:strand:+ start:30 stop:356 length:327 start_codon:yes stop_codon:yes gene_type:complete